MTQKFATHLVSHHITRKDFIVGIEDVSKKVGLLLVPGGITDPELRAIKDSWDKNTGAGRNEEETRKLANAYVEKYPEKFEDIRNMTLDDLVKAVEVQRDAGFETLQWTVETWLIAKVPPQQIGGTLNLPVDIPIQEVLNNGR